MNKKVEVEKGNKEVEVEKGNKEEDYQRGYSVVLQQKVV